MALPVINDSDYKKKILDRMEKEYKQDLLKN